MKRAQSTTSRNRFQTVSDMSEQNRQLFEKAGIDVDPIQLKDVGSEIDFFRKTICQNVDWDRQVSAMQRLMGLVNGGALKNEYFKKEIVCIYSGCAAAVTNLRSALVKQACLLISQLAREMGSSFDQFGDFIIPLSTQLSHGTHVIAESCKLAILCICSNCQSRRILLSMIELSGKKGAATKAAAAEGFSKIFSSWNMDAFSSIWPKAEKCVIQLCSDASPEARSYARDAVCGLLENDPKRAAKLISQLDPRTKRAFEDLDTNQFNEVNNDNDNSPIKKPARAASVKRESRLKPPAERKKLNPVQYIKETEIANDNTNSPDNNDFKNTRTVIPKRRNASIDNARRFRNRRSEMPRFDDKQYEIPENQDEYEDIANKPKLKTRNNQTHTTNNEDNQTLQLNDNMKPYNINNQTRKIHYNNEASKPTYNVRPFNAGNQVKKKNDYNVEISQPNYNAKPSNINNQAPDDNIRYRANSHYRPQTTMRQTRMNQELDEEEIPEIKKAPTRRLRAPSASRVTQRETRNEDLPTRNHVQPNQERPSRFSARARAPSASKVESAIRAKRSQDEYNQKVEDPIRNARNNTAANANNSPSSSKNRTIRRQATTATQNQRPVPPRFQLQNGQERSFLAGIRKIIDEGDTSELSENLTDIALGVLKCCIHSSPQIQGAAFAILNDIIPPYSSHFQPSLPKLVGLLVHAIESNVPRASSTAQMILNSLPKYFECNELIRVCILQPTTYPILTTLGSLISMKEAQLSNDKLCLQLLQFAFAFHKSLDMKIRHTTAHIMMRIDQANHFALKQFCESLSEKQQESFEDFIGPYIPDLSFNQVNIDIPHFESKSAISFRHKINDIIDSVSDKDWIDIRSQVYDELNTAMQSRGQEKPILNLIKNILQDRGTSEFHKLMPGLLSLSKGAYSSIVNNVLVIIMNGTDVNEFVSVLVQLAISNSGLTYYAIEMITRVYATVKPKDAVPSFHTAFPLLQNEFSNENPEIRKCVVMCFVEMKVVDNDAAEHFISTLAKSQQKLISVYYSKRISK